MTIARWVSLVFCAAFCAFAILLRPTYMVIYAFGYMVFPLTAIWFGDELGAYLSEPRFGPRVSGMFLKLMGWVLLLLTPLAVYAFKMRWEWTEQLR